MRTVTAFIVRIFVDDAFPDRLRGTLQAVEGQEKLAFHDAEGLLAALHQAVRSSPAAVSDPESPQSPNVQPDARSAPEINPSQRNKETPA